MDKLNKNGFTLIELMITTAVIIVLSTIVIASLNMSKRFADSRDDRRSADVTRILSAVYSYIVDNTGSYPTGLSNAMPERQMGSAVSGATISTGGCSVSNTVALDLSESLAPYLKSIPVDPNGTSVLTKYAISIDANGIITVRACGTEKSIISESK